VTNEGNTSREDPLSDESLTARLPISLIVAKEKSENENNPLE